MLIADTEPETATFNTQKVSLSVTNFNVILLPVSQSSKTKPVLRNIKDKARQQKQKKDVKAI